MAPDEPTGARPAPVVLRIKLRYDDVETLAQKFAPNVGKSGLFLPTKSLQAIGAEVKFELRLSDDRVVITGLGKVKAAKAPDPTQPRAAYGMAIELMRVTRESRDVILKILAKRKELGLSEVAIPLPADIEAARGMIDTGVINIGSIPKEMPLVESGPVRESAPILETPLPTSAPVATTRPETSAPSVLTAPRRASGPLAIAKIHTVPVLAPEPPRKKRAGMQELIDRASGPTATSVGLEEEIDVTAVLARARSLAGNDLDAELAALLDQASAPIEISIEAASAELARQLGGLAVARDRSARWAPPPPVEPKVEALIEALVDAPTEVPPADAPPADDATNDATTNDVANDAIADEVPAVPELSLDDAAPPAEMVGAAPLIDDDMDAEAFVARDSAPALEIAPEQIADEVHQLDEQDFEEVEHTHIGALAPVVYTEPALAAAIEHSVDQQLAAAEEDDAQEDLGFGAKDAYEAPAYVDPDDLDDAPIELRAPAYVEPVTFDQASAPVHRAPTVGGYVQPDTYTKPAIITPAYEPPFAADPVIDPPEMSLPDEVPLDDLEEIDDFEILAEADADDADLLAASGEHDASDRHEVPTGIDDALPAHDPYARPSVLDFAERLELSDEHPAAPDDVRDALAAFETPEPVEPPIYSRYGRPSDEPENGDEPVSEYTHAGAIPEDDYEASISGFPPLDRFDQSDVIQPEPQFLRGAAARSTPRPTSPLPVAPVALPPQRRTDGYDLETALEALDVDLDDLSIPHQKTELPSRPTASRRVEPRIPKRAQTDEGVMIDFDDDD